MALWSVLKITDGTTSVSLLAGPGFYLSEWIPAIAESKGGGAWRDSPLSDGRRLAFRRFGNVIETFILNVSDTDQEAVIHETQDLRRLLEAALDYWTGTVSAPVWIEARAECETSSRFALVHDYRTPQDGNPYGPQFSPQSGIPSFGEWQLLIERGHWMDKAPGESNCVAISSLQTGYLYEDDLVLNGGFETLGGGGADVFANWVESAAGVSVGAPIFGARSCRLDGAAYGATVQQDIAVVASDEYLLTFYYKNDPGPTNPTGTLTVVDVTHGFPIPWHNQIILPFSLIATQYQMIVSVPGGCNTIGILLTSTDVAGDFIEYDNVTLMHVEEYDFGRAASCDSVHFVQNRFQPAQITHMYRYVDATGVFSANLMHSVIPFSLFSIAAVDDAFYIGVADGSRYPGPFDSVVFNLLNNLNPGVTEIQTTVEYYTSAGAWAALITSDQTVSSDPTLHLQSEGINILAWHPPCQDTELNYWVRTTVNGVFGWWIRIRVLSTLGGPTITQFFDKPYSPTIPRLSITADQLDGDISSLISASACMNPLTVSGVDVIDAAGLTVAFRKQSRGLEFNPYLNLTNDVQIPGLSITTTGTLVERADFPGRTAVSFDIAAGGGDSLTLTIDNTLVNHYLGKYRAFLRISNWPDFWPAPDARLSVNAGGIATGEWVSLADETISAGNWYMTAYDFGTISIPVGNTLDKALWEASLTVEFRNTSAANQRCIAYDLVLVPVDENTVSAVVAEELFTQTIGGRYLSAVIDSFFFKDPLRSYSYHEPGDWDTTPEHLTRTLSTIGASALQYKPNEDFYAFFTGQKIKERITPFLPTAYRPKLLAIFRYLSMRGAR